MTHPNHPHVASPAEFQVQGELNSPETIVVGIGNNSRGDDGLGWAFLKRLEEWGRFRGVIEYRYLLMVEDAARISEFSNVIFVDAWRGPLEKGYAFDKVAASREFMFTTHIIPPPSILYLAEELYESVPHAWTLAIAGEQWELGRGLSPYALDNLDRAADYFLSTLC